MLKPVARLLIVFLFLISIAMLKLSAPTAHHREILLFLCVVVFIDVLLLLANHIKQQTDYRLMMFGGNENTSNDPAPEDQITEFEHNLQNESRMEERQQI